MDDTPRRINYLLYSTPVSVCLFNLCPSIQSINQLSRHTSNSLLTSISFQTWFLSHLLFTLSFKQSIAWTPIFCISFLADQVLSISTSRFFFSNMSSRDTAPQLSELDNLLAELEGFEDPNRSSVQKSNNTAKPIPISASSGSRQPSKSDWGK